MHRKVKIILNPMADMGNAWRVARDLRSITEQHGGVDWSGTVYPGHAIDLAQEAGKQGYDMVIAMGGDGTIHEVINGLMKVPEEKRPILGVVPVGSIPIYPADDGFDAILLQRRELHRQHIADEIDELQIAHVVMRK